MRKLIIKITISIIMQIICFVTITLVALEVTFNLDLLNNVSNMEWMTLIILTIIVFNLLFIALYKIMPFNKKRSFSLEC